MSIKFTTFPKEEAETHIAKLRSGRLKLDIVLTEGISETTKDIHNKAAAIIEKHPELGARAKTVIQSLVGHVHGRAMEEIEKALQETLQRKDPNLDTKKAIENTTIWNLGPEGIRATIRGGIVILAPFEGSLEIPKPENPLPQTPEIPKKIISVTELTGILKAIIVFLTENEPTPGDILTIRRKLKEAVGKSSQVVKKIADKFLTKTMFFSSKSPALRPTKESLLVQFVTDPAGLERGTSLELKKSKKPPKKYYTHQKELEELELPSENDGTEDGEITGVLEDDDLRFFKESDRKERGDDYEDEKRKRVRWEHGQKVYRPKPEDFEDRPEEPDEEL